MTLFITLAVPWAVEAAPGDLDLSFGSGGLVSTDFGGGSNESAEALALQPDGRIVVGGSTNFPAGLSHLALARYNPDGSLDATFGTGGKVTAGLALDLGPAIALALQPDDKIVVWTPSTISRINVDGTLDTTFGSGGKVTTEINQFMIGAHAFGIHPDGKIVLAGTASRCSPGCSNDFILARYTADGAVDASFGSGGKVVTDFAGGDDAAMALAVQPDGKVIVLGGWSLPPGPGCCPVGPDRIGLARYNADGSLDGSFGNGGKVTTGLPFTAITGFPFLFDIALQPDGKIVIVRGSSTLTRFNGDGTLDATFATESGGVALALQPDGKIVVAGGGTFPSFPCILGFCPSDFSLARYNPTGTPDPTFGNTGRATTDFPGSNFVPSALALQPDGKIVVMGTITAFGGSANFGLARFEAGPFDTAPILGLHLSRRMFNPSDTLRIDVTATNPGAAFDADLYVGALLPDGANLAFVTAFAPPAFVGSALTGDPRTFRPALTNLAIPEGFTGALVSGFPFTFAGVEPLGGYLAFAVLAKPGASQDGRIDPGDILASAVKDFSFSGLTGSTPITPLDNTVFKPSDQSGRCWTFLFDWTEAHSSFGIYGYFLAVRYENAPANTDAFLFRFVTASELTVTRCAVFGAPALALEWSVQAMDNLGNFTPWSEGVAIRLEH